MQSIPRGRLGTPGIPRASPHEPPGIAQGSHWTIGNSRDPPLTPPRNPWGPPRGTLEEPVEKSRGQPSASPRAPREVPKDPQGLPKASLRDPSVPIPDI